jgi:hypothetical protein
MSAAWAPLQNRGNISAGGEEEVTLSPFREVLLLRLFLTTFRSKRALQQMESRLLLAHTLPSHASQPSTPLLTAILDPPPLPRAPAFSDQATPTPPTRPEGLPHLENSSCVPLTHPTLAEISGIQSSSSNEVQHLLWSGPSTVLSATPKNRTLDDIELSEDEIQDLFQE